jgi:excisionase family DNA binding protein
MARKSPKTRPTSASPNPPSKRPQAKQQPDEGLLDMNEAIAMLKTTRATFYRLLRSGQLSGMKVGRQWRFDRKEIDRFLRGEKPRVELRADMTPLLSALEKRARKAGAKSSSLPAESDVQRAVRWMIELGLALHASDIHLAPHVQEKSPDRVGILRYRVDGVLHPVAEIDIRLLPAIVEQWKVDARLNVRESNPQDGRMVFSVAGEARPVDIRVSLLPTGLGESLTARILRSENIILPLDRMGHSARDKEKLLRCLQLPWGMIVVSGPTGCGKTTLLYACCNHLAGPELKVMSVEDPIEYYFPWMVQVQVNEREGLSFARVIRSFLRADPDVILVGEMRDGETLAVSQQAALSGHLVMLTLHADEAAKALTRMIEVGSAPFLVADTTKLVISQRLVRLLCPECSRPRDPSRPSLDRAQALARAGGLDWAGLKADWREPVGCDACGGLGYRGRTTISEFLEVTPRIAEAVRHRASVDELRVIAVGEGMTSMAADGLRKAAAGQTTLEEAFRALPSP